MDQSNARDRLISALARAGVRVEPSDEPAAFTVEQWQALQRGETTAAFTHQRPAPHPDFPDYEAGATDEQIARGLREQAERTERGEYVLDGGHDPNDPEWKRYLAAKRARREASIRGER